MDRAGKGGRVSRDEALSRILNLREDESGDEDGDSESEIHSDPDDSNYEQSDDSDDSDSDVSDKAVAAVVKAVSASATSSSSSNVRTTIGSSSGSESDTDSDIDGLIDDRATTTTANSTTTGTVRTADGTEWKRVTGGDCDKGRQQSANVFSRRAGPSTYTYGAKTPLDFFLLIFDLGLLRRIVLFTEAYAHEVHNDTDWKFSVEQLTSFIGFLFMRGCLNMKNFPVCDLYSKLYGIPFFRNCMSRAKFYKIMKYLRFDDRKQRSARLKSDKFALMSTVLSRVVKNSQLAFVPNCELTIDEQLFPTKARCRFTQYMPAKPDKFGIKFWLLCEVESKYCFNILPYLGKDENRQGGLGEHVVTSLLRPLFNHGYNVTTDNFFTSKALAESLYQKRTTIVGTVRMNRREVPKLGKLELYKSVFFQCNQCNLAIYQAKTNKCVCVLSTMHKGCAVEDENKKKPDTVLYYNSTKCGVDMMDSMARAMSTKSATRRWPMAVFFNLLDIAAINAFVLYSQTIGTSKLRRRTFLRVLAEEMTGQIQQPDAGVPIPPNQPAAPVKRKRSVCQVKQNCKQNKSTVLCNSCNKLVCGKCSVAVCNNCA